MRKRTTNPVYKSDFHYDALTDISTCIINHYKYIVKDKQDMNSGMHLNDTHPNEFTKGQFKKI